MKTKFKPEKIEIFDLGPSSEVFYHSTWLSFGEARRFYSELKDKIPFQQHLVSIAAAGNTIAQPRLTCWFGDFSYTYSGLTIQPNPWVPELLQLRDKLREDLDVEFNSVLANYYQNGSNYVGYHADNEKQIGPVIASVSLGGLRTFGIKNQALNKNYSIELQTGSLLVMAKDTQKHCAHCITKTSREVEPRINLTFRVLTEVKK